NLLRAGRGPADSRRRRDRDADVLVPGQDRLPVICVYLDPRHAAALPLRPVNEFCLEIPVPRGVTESACHRVDGGVVFLRSMDVILFLAFATIAVVCAISLVVQTHPISSALSLIGVMGSLAVLYLLLGAEFIAMAQVIVYAGAIMVLFV